MKFVNTLLLSIALAGCSTAPVTTHDESPLFSDRLFKPASEYVGADQIFTLTPEMKQFLDKEVIGQMKSKDPQQALIDALYSKGQLWVDYDSSITRTASQAFASRSANCLSMAIMTAAMAKAIGLNVQFHRIYVDEVWNRSEKLYFATGHVNITLNEKPSAVALDVRRPMTVDFVPPNELRRYESEVVEEKTIVAMYMNNRAAEALAAGQIDNAYWWTHAAIVQDPSLDITYNTLGVIYRMHGNPAEAEHAFQRALDKHPKDVIVMSNLAQALAALGRMEEARAMERRVEKLRPYPPFYYFDKGMAAMKTGDFKQAKSMFRKELEHTPDYHEFQYWYAMACLGLGETREAERYLSLAMENSTTRKDRDIYAAKLDRIKSYTTNPVHPS